MKRLRPQSQSCAAIAHALSVTALLTVLGTPARCVELTDGERQPFDRPLTPDESRWLMDRYDSRRFQLIRDEQNGAIEIEVQPQRQFQELMPPELRRIQQDLGGPVVNQMQELRPQDQRPPAPSTAPSTRDEEARQKSEELRRRSTLQALREAASQLDSIANRLEQLDLFRQADGLREQAQRLRLDARSMIERPQSGPMPTPALGMSERERDWLQPRPTRAQRPAEWSDQGSQEGPARPLPGPTPEPASAAEPSPSE